MRIGCPNCGALYEVPDDVIPPEGRDVQCSNCGFTWFQSHPDHPTAEAEAPAPAPSASAEPAEPQPGREPEDAEDEEDIAREAPWVGRKRTVSPEIEKILREEAEREARARAGLEQPGEAARSEPEPPATEAGAPEEAAPPAAGSTREAERLRAEIAMTVEATRVRAEEPPQAAAPAERGGESLPAIEEINASLTAPGEELRELREEPVVPEAVPEGRGFTRGFALGLLLVVLLGAVYVYADRIAALVPQAEPALQSYVATIDILRGELDRSAERFVRWVEEVAAGTGAS